jgi:H+/gluconate symporter-like permease
MTTTQTSSLPTATLVAAADELAKIAAAKKKRRSRRMEAVKKFAKTLGIVSLGYGAGHGTAMLIEHAGKKLGMGKSWTNLSPNTRARLIRPFLGLATGVGMVAASNLKKKMKKARE